jgi:hypothetical protein
MVSVEIDTPCEANTYELPVAVEESFLYADFDNVDLDFIPYDGVVFQEVPNPSPSGINTSASVGRVNKTIGSTHYAGIEADVYEIAFDLRPLMSQKVYSSTNGIVRFMVDDETTDEPRVRLDLNYNPEDVNQWVQLIYDFTDTPAEVYDQLRLTYNHFVTTTEFWYFDDVMGHTEGFLSTTSGEEMTEVIAVYPNPSSGLFSVDTKGIFPAGSMYVLEVLDVQGRSLLSQQVLAQGQLVAFDLSDQPTGLYFLRLSGESLRYFKVIKK